MSKERYEILSLKPPAEGFELYRHKNAGQMSTRGWSGLYWARKDEAGTTRSEPSQGKVRRTR